VRSVEVRCYEMRGGEVIWCDLRWGVDVRRGEVRSGNLRC
jgi:hypothetical protein